MKLPWTEGLPLAEMKNWGELNTLYASQRNSSALLSLIRTTFNKAISKLTKPGPEKEAKGQSPRVPRVSWVKSEVLKAGKLGFE